MAIYATGNGNMEGDSEAPHYLALFDIFDAIREYANYHHIEIRIEIAANFSCRTRDKQNEGYSINAIPLGCPEEEIPFHGENLQRLVADIVQAHFGNSAINAPPSAPPLPSPPIKPSQIVKPLSQSKRKQTGSCDDMGNMRFV